jgi:glycerophosphoryl diester phosphodiesterase
MAPRSQSHPHGGQAIIGAMRRPSIIAHRGASGYEYENSLAAFRRAVLMDADGVELDVHTTRDGAIVVHHDPELPEVGVISSLDLAAVRRIRLPNGEPVPLLAEVLDLMGNREAWVEVKALPPDCDGSLLQVLDAGPAPARYGVHSFDHRIVRRLAERRASLRTGILVSSYLVDPVAALRASRAAVLWQEWHLIDQDLVDRVHRAGCTVIAWTVNRLGDLERLTQLGVDGLCGNYPDRIRVAVGACNSQPADESA